MKYQLKTDAIVNAVASALCVAVLFLPGAVLAQDSYPTYDFGGRIQADNTNYDNDKYQYQDGTEVRRLRAYLRGNLSENWEYRGQFDFASTNTSLKDGYLRYTGLENQLITIGQFKVFSGLEELTSSNNITFTERSLANALDEGRRVGVGYQRWSSRYSFSIAAYSHESANSKRGEGISSRAVYRPNIGDGQLLHLGVNVSRQSPESNSLRIRSRAETHQDSNRIVDTRSIPNVDSYSKQGVELAYVNGRFSAQAEFSRQPIKLSAGTTAVTSTNTGANIDPTFSAYYFDMSWFLTDDSRPYSNSSAAFGTLTPSADTGAWQLGARISNLNLNDAGISGGEVDSISLGVNYYMNRDLRFTATYVMADSKDDDPNAIHLRVRYTF
ncbi:MAG: OprO/OprP family phosphate-selective porin [Pseudohongiellaceae bacterium]